MTAYTRQELLIRRPEKQLPEANTWIAEEQSCWVQQLTRRPQSHQWSQGQQVDFGQLLVKSPLMLRDRPQRENQWAHAAAVNPWQFFHEQADLIPWTQPLNPSATIGQNLPQVLDRRPHIKRKTILVTAIFVLTAFFENLVLHSSSWWQSLQFLL